MIVQGNSFSLPFADASFHCVVTSIPYYGLRDYELEPIVIGGTHECEHNWKREFPGINNRGTDDLGDWKQSTNAASVVKSAASDFCQKCHAWRGSLGLEPSPELFIEHIITVFREVWRVLRDDGTVFLNVGDSYWGGKGQSGQATSERQRERFENGESINHEYQQLGWKGQTGPKDGKHPWIKPKDLIGIPAMLEIALKKAGWYFRSRIIWEKRNPMPESVQDRPTNSHEYIFLLAKNRHYFYDGYAIREGVSPSSLARINQSTFNNQNGGDKDYKHGTNPNRSARKTVENFAKNTDGTRNARDVWHINTRGFPGSHFAVFPEELAARCIKAGTSEKGCCNNCGAPWQRTVEKGFTDHEAETETLYEKGFSANRLSLLRQASRKRGEEYVNKSKTVGWRPTCSCDLTETMPSRVLDPFGGSGTVLDVAQRLGRKATVVDFKWEYCQMAKTRCFKPQGELF